MIGSIDVSVNVNDMLSQELSDQTIFPRDDERMYFYVREGFSLTRQSEGFCKKIKVTSEMLNGEVIIDGWYQTDLSIGDTFTLTQSPKHSLRAMKLEL